MSTGNSNTGRRKFMQALGLSGAAAVAAVAVRQGAKPEGEGAVVDSGRKGYHVTEHVRKYYSTTRV